MKLFLQSGGRTFEEWLEKISSKELSLWLAREGIDPLDDPFWRSAMEAHTTAKSLGGKDCKLTLLDLYPPQVQQYYGKKKAKTKQTPDQTAAILKAIAKPKKKPS